MTETKQALDEVLALLDVRTDGYYLARLANGQSIATQCCQFLRAEGRNLAHIPADWQPTPEAINALPEPLRAYIHRIETSHPSYDNAVRIRQLEEQVEQLQAALGEAERDAGRWRRFRRIDGGTAWREHDYALVGVNVPKERNTCAFEVSPEILDAAIDAMAAGEPCWCLTCRPLSVADTRFVVCPDCGNKRCPKANDHRHACTGSNEPGQPGSAYPAPEGK